MTNQATSTPLFEFPQVELAAIAEHYLVTLIGGDGDALVKTVGAGATIDDPHCGRITGTDGVRAFSKDFNEWIEGYDARVEHVRTTGSDERVCSEAVLHLNVGDKPVQLPVATVVSSDGTTARIHVYYTKWPFTETHSVRAGLFAKPETNAEHTDVILRYFECLNTGDIERLMTCFEADIYFREASGPPYVHWGTAAVRNYFLGLFGKGAPMLRDDTILDDGRCVVMEFSVIGWNGIPREPDDWEAGLAVYERSEEGLMRAIRIYDDVDF